MDEYYEKREMVVNAGEPIIFENKTDSEFGVNYGIVFRKSGIYEVSIAGNKTIVSKVSERKKGKWIDTGSGQECSECHEIQYGYDNFRYFCPNCGADMREDGE